MNVRGARLEAIVFGRVQGVGFRWHVQRQAALLGLTGGVRNRHEGTVEVIAEGPEAAVASLLADLHRGPSGSDVTQVVSSTHPGTGEFTSFEIWSSR